MMEVILLIIAMIFAGILMGAVAGLIWKDNRPIGVKGDYLAAIITTVILLTTMVYCSIVI